MLARAPIRSRQRHRKGNLLQAKSLAISARESQLGNYSTTTSIPSSSQEISDALEEVGVEAEADGEDTPPSSDSPSLNDELHRYKTTFKTWMRTVPKSVAIITAKRQDVEDEATRIVGATVSSFNTVAFEPEVYVSFNLKQDSLTLKTILETKHFCATFPINNKYGSALAAEFAKMNGPATKFHRCYDSRWTSYFANRGIKYPPCPVSNKRRVDGPRSATAFAAWYEYHSSIAVGDHVIVTAKALPILFQTRPPAWHTPSNTDSPFFTSMQTLGHIHGEFTDGVATTFDSSYVLDDKFRGAGSASTEKMLEFYTARLEMLGMTMNEYARERAADRTSAAGLDPERRSQYVRYYMARVAMLRSQAEPAIGPLPDLADELDPWEQLQVRLKKLLSFEQLEEEKQTCLRRLLVLESDPHSDPKDLDGEDGQIVEAADDLSDDSPTHRIEGLRFYWKTRLRHISKAQLEKMLTNIDDDKQLNMLDHLSGSERKFVMARRDWPVAWLEGSRQQYARIASELQIEIMRAWGSKQVEKDEKAKNRKFANKALQHLKTMNRNVNVLSWLIARRRHLEDKSRIQREPVLPRIPDDTEIQEKSRGYTYSVGDLKGFMLEASTKIEEAKDKEISQEEFDGLLSDVMSNFNSKRTG